MTFEDTFKRVVEEYRTLINREMFSSEEVTGIHTRLQAGNYQFSPDGSLKTYSIPFPGGETIYNEHPLSSVRYESPLPGRIDVGYDSSRVSKIYLTFWPGLCPRMMNKKDFWRHRKGFDAEVTENRTKEGVLYAQLGQVGSGVFFSRPALRKHKRSSLLFKTWSLRIPEYISEIKFPVEILGDGELTAFFRHVNYDGLEKLFSN
ncbi:MAG: hypothetical protein V2A62_00575 [Candidatus Woesearchaeota archaeon]